MLKPGICISVFMLSSLGFAASSKYSNCAGVLNDALSASIPLANFGIGIHFDESGKVVESTPGALVSRSIFGGVETVKYKIQRNKVGANGSPTSEKIYVTETLTVKRDSEGNVTGFTVVPDKASQPSNIPNPYLTAIDGIPITNLVENKVSMDDGSCALEQRTRNWTNDKGTNDVVEYDKATCDKLGPLIAKMGKSRVEECSNLLLSADRTLMSKMSDFLSEGKTLPGGGISLSTALRVINKCIAMNPSLGSPTGSRKSLPPPLPGASSSSNGIN